MGVCPSMPEEKSIHEFVVKGGSGRDVALSRYRGKVLLIVNVASKCTFTDSNYTQLSDLYSRYKDKGLEILAFPCNQVRVNGANAAPIYKHLKSQKPGFFGCRIKWNFTKFLVDKNGYVLDRYAPTTPPLHIEDDIKKALEKAQDGKIIIWT